MSCMGYNRGVYIREVIWNMCCSVRCHDRYFENVFKNVFENDPGRIRILMVLISYKRNEQGNYDTQITKTIEIE
jgi:hypothetical protein